jgi:hypothetical protein
MMVSRFLQKKVVDENFDPAAELKIHPWLNWLFETILGTELSMIRNGLNFPLGGSRLVVARKL